MRIHCHVRGSKRKLSTICFSAVSFALGRGVKTGLCKLGRFILQSDKLEMYDSLKNNERTGGRVFFLCLLVQKLRWIK